MAGQAQVPVPPLPRNARPGHQPLGQVFSDSKGKYLQFCRPWHTAGACSLSFLSPAPTPALLTRAGAAPALLRHRAGHPGAIPASVWAASARQRQCPRAPAPHQGRALLTSTAAFLPFVPPRIPGAPASRKPAGKKLRRSLSLVRGLVQGNGEENWVREVETQATAFGGVVSYRAALQPYGFHLGLMSKRWEGERAADTSAGCPCDSCALLLC